MAVPTNETNPLPFEEADADVVSQEHFSFTDVLTWLGALNPFAESRTSSLMLIWVSD